VETLRALGALSEPPEPGRHRLADLLGLPAAPDAAAYTQTMVWQLYPYASVYLGDAGMLGGEARDRIAGFMRSLEITPPAEPDHLATLLGLYADLADREQTAIGTQEQAAWRRARAAMLWEHLLTWLPAYLDEITARAPDPYPQWAKLLGGALIREAGIVGPPADTPLALRAAAPIPDPREHPADEFLDGLLAPVRSGMIVSRTVLAETARDLGLGYRLGERRFILTSLLGQDAAATLRWLSAHATTVTDRPHDFAPVTRHWQQRARTTAALLTDLARDAERTFATA
jgi:hypothetical protein